MTPQRDNPILINARNQHTHKLMIPDAKIAAGSQQALTKTANYISRWTIDHTQLCAHLRPKRTTVLYITSINITLPIAIPKALKDTQGCNQRVSVSHNMDFVIALTVEL